MSPLPDMRGLVTALPTEYDGSDVLLLRLRLLVASIWLSLDAGSWDFLPPAAML